MLTLREVVPYLLERGLIRKESIVDSDLNLEDASRRNRNFKVISEHGPCYLIKQGIGPDGIATVAHEAAVYRLLESNNGKDGVRGFLPRSYGYDPEEHVLILEYLRDTRDLREFHAHRGRFSITVAEELGEALSAIHRSTRKETMKDENIRVLAHGLPWVLFLHRPDLTIFHDISSANLQVIKIIQQFAEFCELLDGLRREWRTETLIHFDIKWDNCIVKPKSAGRRKSELKIVDWEVAGLGDPCWDVGSVFNDYLSFWLLSIPITGETPPDRFLELARYPLNKMMPAIRSFWRSYATQMGLDAAKNNEWLVRSVRYAAARLVQSAYEQMQMSMQLTGNVVCFLQLSLNMLQRPEEATVQLLGLPLQRSGST